ncbi:MAG: ORF6N domain-containing protein [Flavobacteriales bacterium]|nr:ORF6N domain-containing protein [Flavobacteriales bacterium]
MEIMISQIEKNIYTVRGVQVIFDNDLARFYQTETKYINRAVNRNPKRFPPEFAFQLNEKEWEALRFQIGTLNGKSTRGSHRKYLPWVFTEQGVTMLSSVLNNETSIQISIQIVKAFVSMRKFMASQQGLIQRMDGLERKQLETDNKFERVFKALEQNTIPTQGVFFDGQIYDAYELISKIIRSAKKEIILIDNYIDETVLTHLSKRAENVEAIIYTKSVSRVLQLDLERHNSQYPSIQIKEHRDSHDRFLIIDQKELYHIGASLKDLGKKWFAFLKMNSFLPEVLGKIEN